MSADLDLILDAEGHSTPEAARIRADLIRADFGLVAVWLVRVTTAYAQRDWEALGYDSWDAYTDGEFGELKVKLPRPLRQEVVARMSATQMSTRAIAAVVGVHHDTVASDRRASSPVGNPTPETEQEPPGVVGPSEPIPATTVTRDELAAELTDESAFERKYGMRGDEADALVSSGLVQTRDEFDAAAKVLNSNDPEPRTTGLDGKSYPKPEPTRPAPRTPKRRPIPDAFFDAAVDLAKITDRIERLIADDRFPLNAERVATKHRSDLIRARDALQGVIDRLPSA